MLIKVSYSSFVSGDKNILSLGFPGKNLHRYLFFLILVPNRVIFLFAYVKSSFDHCKALIFENVKTISLITGDPLSFISIRRKGWRILANSIFDSLANFIFD